MHLSYAWWLNLLIVNWHGWNCDVCMIHLLIWTWNDDIEWSWMIWMLWILVSTCMICYSSFLNISFIPNALVNFYYGLWWCNANPQWFTTYLSVWTSRWSAGCLDCMLDVAEERRSSFYVQVSRLGLWSKVVLACWILFWLCSFGVEILILFEIERCIYYQEIWRWYLYGLYICSAAMFMKLDKLYIYVGVCFEVPPISRIYLMYSRVLPFIRVGCYSSPWRTSCIQPGRNTKDTTHTLA
jgi:hypothetical protein